MLDLYLSSCGWGAIKESTAEWSGVRARLAFFRPLTQPALCFASPLRPQRPHIQSLALGNLNINNFCPRALAGWGWSGETLHSHLFSLEIWRGYSCYLSFPCPARLPASNYW